VDVATAISEAYRAVIPEECHEAVGERELAHVALEQHLAPASGSLCQKDAVFSKSDEMHEVCLKLFLHRYNADVILH
jgi:hypothetical protein